MLEPWEWTTLSSSSGFSPAWRRDELLVEGVAAEGVDVPRFEMREQASLSRIALQVIVDTGGESVGDLAGAGAGALVFGLGEARDFEYANGFIVVQS